MMMPAIIIIHIIMAAADLRSGATCVAMSRLDEVDLSKSLSREKEDERLAAAQTRLLFLRLVLGGQMAKAGEDFAELAKQLSNHPSAVNGGDLGYLHEGMLDTRVQQQLESLELNQLGEPLRVLEGVLLFRLDGVRPAQLRPYDEVKQRAADLLYREQQDAAWQSYVNTLRSSANVYVNQ